MAWPCVYVAGPLNATNAVDYLKNVSRMFKQALRFTKLGAYPYCPTWDIMLGIIDGSLGYEDYFQLNQPWLERCDALYYIDHSPGTDREIARARELGIPVFNHMEDFCRWSGLSYAEPPESVEQTLSPTLAPYCEDASRRNELLKELFRQLDPNDGIFGRIPPGDWKLKEPLPGSESSVEGMKDSGSRETFAGGAVRDTHSEKIRPDLISPYADSREGEWLRKGAVKYDERNWEKGIPISRCLASLERHLVAYKQGLSDEDHMAAIRTNAGFILHFEEMIQRGLLPSELDDLPRYEGAEDKGECKSPGTGLAGLVSSWGAAASPTPTTSRSSHPAALTRREKETRDDKFNG